MSHCVSLVDPKRREILRKYREGVPSEVQPDRPLTPGEWQACGFSNLQEMFEYLKPVPLVVVRMKCGRTVWLARHLRITVNGKAACQEYHKWIGYHWVWDNDEQRLAEEIAIARYQAGA